MLALHNFWNDAWGQGDWVTSFTKVFSYWSAKEPKLVSPQGRTEESEVWQHQHAQILWDQDPDRFAQHTSDYVIFKMSLFPVSEAYNPLLLAWKGSLFCVHLQCLINFLQCTCRSPCWDIWEVNQHKMAFLCLSWKGKLLPSITGALPCWTNTHNPELTYCSCKHHCASLVGSLPKSQDFGVCHNQVRKQKLLSLTI